MTNYAISVGVADVRRDPSPDAELVTQALMNVPARADTLSGEWTHVALSDYAGWVRSRELAAPALSTPSASVAVIALTHAPLFATADSAEAVSMAYLSTVLPVVSSTTYGGRLQVSLPGKRLAWVAREAVCIRPCEQVYPVEAVNVVTDYAREFLGIEYLWGGTSWEGIDCSGLVQLCYRMGGSIIPRDADQQHDALVDSISREAIREGDLIFFGRNAITHVGMALNNKEYIHAEGSRYNRVTINSFDPTDPRYDQRLDTIVQAVKRVVV